MTNNLTKLTKIRNRMKINLALIFKINHNLIKINKFKKIFINQSQTKCKMHSSLKSHNHSINKTKIFII